MMRITNGAAIAAITETNNLQDSEIKPRASYPIQPASRGEVLRDAVVIKAAHAALKEIPEIDAARVAEIKTALAAGEMPFDAGKLARLVLRYHGGKE